MQPPKDPSFAAESTREWWARPGALYFLSVGNPIVAVKIGMFSIPSSLTLEAALRRRLGQLQTSNHESIVVLGIVHFTTGAYPSRDAEILERELHIEFADLARFKAGTKGAEWFNSSSRLLQRIQELGTPPEQFGLPRCIAEPFHACHG